MKKQNQAFSLTELIVVIILLCCLATFIPMAWMASDKAKDAASLSVLHQVALLAATLQKQNGQFSDTAADYSALSGGTVTTGTTIDNALQISLHPVSSDLTKNICLSAIGPSGQQYFMGLSNQANGSNGKPIVTFHKAASNSANYPATLAASTICELNTTGDTGEVANPDPANFLTGF